VQPIALWLVARPQNGVLGLALTLLFPLSPVISGLVMAHLVFAKGVRVPALQGVVAGALLALIALIMSASVGQIVASAVTWWVPVFLLAALARQWRSTTLALQVSVIIAMAVTIGFFVVLGDPADYWNETIAASIELARQAGLTEQADMLAESQSLIVPQMTMLFVFSTWSFYVMVVMVGYALYQVLPGKKSVYGRFCDLNFGRVLAGIMAVISVAALVSGSVSLQNLGFVAFAIFWLQGLAILHWLHTERRLPVFVVIMMYALLPCLNVLLVLTFAVLGYMDAWFDFRARGKIQDDRV
jgi:hypothetical protein